MASHFAVVALLLSVVCCTSEAAAYYPPPATLYGTNQRICNYQFAVPAGSNCVQTGQDIKQQISSIRQDIDRMKLSNVQQNTILQEQIDKLNKQAAATDTSVADLTKEFKNLQSTIMNLQLTVTQLSQGGSSGGGGGSVAGPSNAALQQLVARTTTQLRTDIQTLQTEVYRVKRDYQQDSIQQSKVDSAFQAQLQQQQQDEALLRQDLNNLRNIVNGLSHRIPINIATMPPVTATSTAPATTTTTTAATTTTTSATTTTNPQTTASTSAGSTTPNPLLTQLQTTVQNLETRLQKLEQDFQTDITDLKQNMTILQAQGKQQMLNVSNAVVEVEYLMNNVIPQLQQKVNTNYGAIQQINQFRTTQFQPLERQVQKVAQNVTALASQITSIGTNTLNQVTNIHKNEQSINDVKVQVRLLASKLTRLQQSLHVTLPPPTTRATTTTTFAIPTPRPHNG